MCRNAGMAQNTVLTFQPEQTQWQREVEHTMVTAVKLVMDHTRLIDDDATFKEYTQVRAARVQVYAGGSHSQCAPSQVSAEDGDDDQSQELDLEMQVMQDEQFVDVVDGVKTALSRAFQHASEYTTVSAERWADRQDTAH